MQQILTLKNQNQEMEAFNGTNFLPGLEAFSWIEGVAILDDQLIGK